jgi:glycosyltransferase involved in cell wall biosynthesis
MAHIVIADSTNRYNGLSFATQPLGGTESSVCYMAAALARRGHRVTCYTHGDDVVEHEGVTWRPLAAPRAEAGAILVAVQHPRMLGLFPNPVRRVVWLAWRPNNLHHYKQLPRMWWYRPRPVFISEYQATIYSPLLPPARPRRIVPHGLPDAVRGKAPLPAPPPPHAVFASNPVRGLTWLIDLWAREIQPRVPGGKLHVFGIRNYAHRYGDPWTTSLDPFLPPGVSPVARASLVIHPTATREELWAAMRASRVMLYGGHKSEMFCLSLAEAQALGVPAVIKPVAVLPERVRDNVSGFIRNEDREFAERAVALLTDDALWRRQHHAALAMQQGISWDDAAAAFERAILD